MPKVSRLEVHKEHILDLYSKKASCLAIGKEDKKISQEVYYFDPFL